MKPALFTARSSLDLGTRLSHRFLGGLNSLSELKDTDSSKDSRPLTSKGPGRAGNFVCRPPGKKIRSFPIIYRAKKATQGSYGIKCLQRKFC
jgi:hypothetical protein